MIEAVTVCVQYDDFLSVIIPYNLPMFDRWLIVTNSKDERTRELCRKWGLDCLVSDEGDGLDGEFKKGRLIERGLQQLSANGWRVHIDADICLPRRFRQLIDYARLDQDKIYGIDRVMVKGWDQWIKMKESGYLDGLEWHYSHSVAFPKGYEMGSRWASDLTGYVPIGFFQMWHSSQDQWRGIRSKPYPYLHNNACRTDVQHGLQWDRNRRALIPEIICVHLESEECKTGSNWNGRKTKRFGPESQSLQLTMIS